MCFDGHCGPKGKDAFWEKVAIVFNSNKNFDIDRQKGNKRFKTLSAAPVPYITDAAHKLAGYITFVCNSVVPLHWQELQQRTHKPGTVTGHPKPDQSPYTHFTNCLQQAFTIATVLPGAEDYLQLPAFQRYS